MWTVVIIGALEVEGRTVVRGRCLLPARDYQTGRESGRSLLGREGVFLQRDLEWRSRRAGQVVSVTGEEPSASHSRLNPRAMWSHVLQSVHG